MKRFKFSFNNMMSILSCQLFHKSYLDLMRNLSNLIYISTLFLLTDKEPLNITEIFFSSLLINAVTGAFFKLLPVIGNSELCGCSGIAFGMFFHVLARGLFSRRSLDRLCTGLLLCYVAYDVISSGFSSSFLNISEAPFLLGGIISGVGTAILASNRRPSYDYYFYRNRYNY